MAYTGVIKAGGGVKKGGDQSLQKGAPKRGGALGTPGNPPIPNRKIVDAGAKPPGPISPVIKPPAARTQAKAPGKKVVSGNAKVPGPISPVINPAKKRARVATKAAPKPAVKAVASNRSAKTRDMIETIASNVGNNNAIRSKYFNRGKTR